VKAVALGRRLAWLCVALSVFASVGFCWKEYKVHDKLTYSIFDDKFIEPFENLYLLTYDLTLYKITSNDERYVDFHMDWLKKLLKKNGHEISDIMIIIHNHPPNVPRGFSHADIQTWYEFKKEGFTGNFYLYISMLQVIYELREK
jgi:hypothetical protein